MCTHHDTVPRSARGDHTWCKHEDRSIPPGRVRACHNDCKSPDNSPPPCDRPDHSGRNSAPSTCPTNAPYDHSSSTSEKDRTSSVSFPLAPTPSQLLPLGPQKRLRLHRGGPYSDRRPSTGNSSFRLGWDGNRDWVRQKKVNPSNKRRIDSAAPLIQFFHLLTVIRLIYTRPKS